LFYFCPVPSLLKSFGLLILTLLKPLKNEGKPERFVGMTKSVVFEMQKE